MEDEQSGRSLSLRSVLDQLIYSTTRITAWDKDGNESVGTGFIMHFDAVRNGTRGAFFALITNKHVVHGATRGRIIIHNGAVRDGHRVPSGGYSLVDVQDMAHGWIDHPDPSVDLCGIPLVPLIRAFEQSGVHLFFMAIGENTIPAMDDLMEMRVVQDVLMVGYPNGLWDERHGYPITRKGSTASHPALDFSVTVDGVEHLAGVMDIAAFGGSSGSPILAYDPESNYVIGNPVGGEPAPSTAVPKLLGVLFANANAVAGRVILQPVPTRPVVAVPMHIGYYEKAARIFALRDAIFNEVGAVSPADVHPPTL